MNANLTSLAALVALLPGSGCSSLSPAAVYVTKGSQG